jgi:putative transposase
MASTYLDLRVHVVFATKGRQPWIADACRGRLHGYMGGTLHGLGAIPIAIGGTADHLHLLIGLRANHSVADLVRETKKAATAWMRNEASLPTFGWQEGYAAFSVGADARDAVVAYVRNQGAHHRGRSSFDELRALLEEAGVEIDERYFE